MSFARRIYERFQLFIHEMAKFGIVGGLAFLTTELFFNVLLHAGVGTFFANAGSTLAAAVIAFLGNRYWTFRHRERGDMRRETVVFFALNGVGILIQQACIEIAKYMFGRHDTFTLNVAFLLGVGIATMFRFWSYRKWVWHGATPAQREAALAMAAAPVPSAAPAIAPANGHRVQPGSHAQPHGAQPHGTHQHSTHQHSAQANGNGARVNGHEREERIVAVGPGVRPRPNRD